MDKQILNSKPNFFVSPKPKSKGEENLYRFIGESLKNFSGLQTYVYTNQTVLNLVKYLVRHKTQSKNTVKAYIYWLKRFTDYVGKTPDQLIAECYNQDGTLNFKALKVHEGYVDDWIGELQAYKTAQKTLAATVAIIKSFYKRNGITLKVEPLNTTRITYRDMAPTPEQLAKLVDVANLREKVILAFLALTGMRLDTLTKLQYKHIKEDFERGITPLAIYIPAELNKGKYCDYVTFLPSEGVELLKLYFEERKRGKIKGLEVRIKPENITDTSPIIRDTYKPKPISIVTLSSIIHELYVKAGLIQPNNSKRYKFRPHSLRKYFKTQLTALGVQSEIVEYMMGHKTSTYNDVQSLGVEKLRQIYANACQKGFGLRPKTAISKEQIIRQMIQALGENPDEWLAKKTETYPHRTIISQEDRENILTEIFKEILKGMVKS